MSRHFRFISRTVFVKNNEIDDALNSINRLMRNEKISDAIRRNQYYITPCERRQQVDRERAKRLYGSGMAKRVNFLMRKSRPNPFPR
ncbi:small ribosomal subunit protein bS21m-like [Saccostrea cucullata]|uniref:small ribosomal subunit protein bS21m-like n=1 Tax=Saccostrea echinata TaxID=191078 RepID=UPI002A83B9D3|nr:small ribosomal subunit protein bS21m-like [Saccostrea echinata]